MGGLSKASQEGGTKASSLECAVVNEPLVDLGNLARIALKDSYSVPGPVVVGIAFFGSFFIEDTVFGNRSATGGIQPVLNLLHGFFVGVADPYDSTRKGDCFDRAQRVFKSGIRISFYGTAKLQTAPAVSAKVNDVQPTRGDPCVSR